MAEQSTISPPASPPAPVRPLRAVVKAIMPLSARDWTRARLRSLRRSSVRGLLRVAGWLDLNVAQASDVYSALPVLSNLQRNKARWARPSSLGGVEIDAAATRERFERLHAQYGADFDKLPSYAELAKVGFGPGFTPVDARTQFYMLRDLKPRRYLEVGSGLSTYYCTLAAEQNRADGAPMEITCVEPYPYAKLRQTAGVSQIIVSEVQDVKLDLFQTLQAGDVLFIDSSHIVRLDGDVPYLFLEVLPRLNPGVIVHIHDIPFPFNIPFPADYWVFGTVWPRFWTEAMLVQAFLAFNHAFEVQLSLPYWRYHDEASLLRLLPGYPKVAEDVNPFSSLWLKKTA